jgi:hypothetical protein
VKDNEEDNTVFNQLPAFPQLRQKYSGLWINKTGGVLSFTADGNSRQLSKEFMGWLTIHNYVFTALEEIEPPEPPSPPTVANIVAHANLLVPNDLNDLIAQLQNLHH